VYTVIRGLTRALKSEGARRSACTGWRPGKRAREVGVTSQSWERYQGKLVVRQQSLRTF